MLRDCVEPYGKDYRTTRLRALYRDNYRCIVTGLFDQTSVEQYKALTDEFSDIGVCAAPLNVCHILSASIMQGVDPAGDLTGNEIEYAGNAVAILNSFGLEDLVERILPQDGVHHANNLLSLEPTSHGYFDRLDLWFERSEQEPDRYYVCVAKEVNEDFLRLYNYLATDNRGRRYTTFSGKPTDPDPVLLALHAVCARVAHMSGAAEAFDRVERDVETTGVLAVDGSSAHLLDHLLAPLSAVRGVA